MKTDKTCAACSAFDAPKGECHRHPVKPWPKMEPHDWCEDHSPIRDEHGWRKDWPEREAIIKALMMPGSGMTLEEIAKAVKTEDLGAVSAALANLRSQGHATRTLRRWSHPDAPPLPKPARNFTEAELLAQFPKGEKNALPIAVIKRRAMTNLGISEGRFGDERFNLITAGLISKITTPAGEERFFQ